MNGLVEEALDAACEAYAKALTGPVHWRKAVEVALRAYLEVRDSHEPGTYAEQVKEREELRDNMGRYRHSLLGKGSWSDLDESPKESWRSAAFDTPYDLGVKHGFDKGLRITQARLARVTAAETEARALLAAQEARWEAEKQNVKEAALLSIKGLSETLDAANERAEAAELELTEMLDKYNTLKRLVYPQDKDRGADGGIDTKKYGDRVFHAAVQHDPNHYFAPVTWSAEFPEAAILRSRIANLEIWMVAFLSNWARGSFNKEHAANLCKAVHAHCDQYHLSLKDPACTTMQKK